MDGERGNNEPGIVTGGGLRNAFSRGTGKGGLRNADKKRSGFGISPRGTMSSTHQIHLVCRRQVRRIDVIVYWWRVSFRVRPP